MKTTALVVTVAVLALTCGGFGCHKTYPAPANEAAVPASNQEGKANAALGPAEIDRLVREATSEPVISEKEVKSALDAMKDRMAAINDEENRGGVMVDVMLAQASLDAAEQLRTEAGHVTPEALTGVRVALVMLYDAQGRIDGEEYLRKPLSLNQQGTTVHGASLWEPYLLACEMVESRNKALAEWKEKDPVYQAVLESTDNLKTSLRRSARLSSAEKVAALLAEFFALARIEQGRIECLAQMVREFGKLSPQDSGTAGQIIQAEIRQRWGAYASSGKGVLGSLFVEAERIESVSDFEKMTTALEKKSENNCREVRDKIALLAKAR